MRTLWAGFAAAVVYTTVVIVGGSITPGYSHLGQHVSALYQAGAPHGPPIAVAFGVYNVLVALFGVAVGRLTLELGAPRHRLGVACGVALLLTGIAGAFDAVLPQDPVGAPATVTGTLHIVFAGLTSLLTIVAIALAGSWALARPRLRRFGWYSFMSLAAIAIFGPIAAMATVNLSPHVGLLERVPIFGFVQWLLVCALVLRRPDELRLE
jgi:hypothetical protein